MTPEELEDRLINYAVRIIEMSADIKKNYAGNHLSNQIVRSGTSPALNYGEARSAESRKDFIHKVKIILKELRETLICLKLIKRTNLFNKDIVILDSLLSESNELISIFVTSSKTAQNNRL